MNQCHIDKLFPNSFEKSSLCKLFSSVEYLKFFLRIIKILGWRIMGLKQTRCMPLSKTFKTFSQIKAMFFSFSITIKFIMNSEFHWRVIFWLSSYNLYKFLRRTVSIDYWCCCILQNLLRYEITKISRWFWRIPIPNHCFMFLYFIQMFSNHEFKPWLIIFFVV